MKEEVTAAWMQQRTLSKLSAFLNYISKVWYNKRDRKKVNLKLDVTKLEEL